MTSTDSSENESNVKLNDVTPLKGFSPTKYYKQSYRKEWEGMSDFKGWLSGVPGEPTRAYCKFCEKTLHAHRLSLLKHTCTLKHTRAAKNAFHKGTGHAVSQKKVPLQPKPSVTADVVEMDSSEILTAVQLKKETVTAKELPSLDESTMLDSQDKHVDQPAEPHPVNNTQNDSSAPAVPLATLAVNIPKDKVIITEVPESQNVPEPPDEGYISTHILDTSKGLPVAGLQVSLYRLVDGRWTHLGESMSNPDGRSMGFVSKENFVAGRYKLHFDVDRYYERRRIDTLYPFIEIVFDVRSPQEHYHIPLLLSPYGYTTYKGS